MNKLVKHCSICTPWYLKLGFVTDKSDVLIIALLCDVRSYSGYLNDCKCVCHRVPVLPHPVGEPGSEAE